ncbi:MAG: alpha/beta hydrolase-fold protein [Planctomycetota bacterium]|nr:alpha/beta hydrolase-fold protein [Planctomycetota bacterium]
MVDLYQRDPAPPHCSQTLRGRLAITVLVGMLGAMLAAPAALAGVRFRVSFPESLSQNPASGRLVVFLIRQGARVQPNAEPTDGPFWGDPQPMFGIDVRSLAPGEEAVVDDGATFFPVKASELADGSYTAQAVLITTRATSEWKRDEGNLFSRPIRFVSAGGDITDIRITLNERTKGGQPESRDQLRFFQVDSKLLSEFHGNPVVLRAGVVLPTDHDPARAYPAVYEIPGFGDDHRSAQRVARMLGAGADRTKAADKSPRAALHRSAFWIVLDPESPNGHTLFADSANNGPVGRALVEELLPALEKEFNLIAKPEARLVRGHSSGGWSSVWLAITYPETFGGAWSSSPDPVDFRAFQLVDIFAGKSMYHDEAGAATPSYRSGGAELMTIEQENRMEEVLGPRNTSAQQWDSWQAVFGSRATDAHPAALFDPLTGAIDRAESERYRAFDIAERLRAKPGELGPVFKQRIRIVVGDQDNFYLERAVAMLKDEVDAMSFLALPEGEHGFIKVVPGYDHGSIFGSAEVRGFASDMLEHLRRAGVARE